MTTNEMWEAVKTNDDSYDGIFFYAVKSTGIYCRPSCKSKLPNRENICFFENSDEARVAGFRPCKRCRPDLLDYKPIKEIAEKTKQMLEQSFIAETKFQSEIRKIGVTPHRMNQIFKEEYGVTAAEYVNDLKIAEARKRLAETDDKIIEIGYSLGFRSLSGFYRFFKKNEGVSPAKFRKGNNEK